MKIILIFTTLFLIDICAFTQTRNIVKTPKGQDVTDSWTIPELLSYQDKLDISDSIALLYPWPQKLMLPQRHPYIIAMDMPGILLKMVLQ